MKDFALLILALIVIVLAFNAGKQQSTNKAVIEAIHQHNIAICDMNSSIEMLGGLKK